MMKNEVGVEDEEFLLREYFIIIKLVDIVITVLIIPLQFIM